MPCQSGVNPYNYQVNDLKDTVKPTFVCVIKKAVKICYWFCQLLSKYLLHNIQQYLVNLGIVEQYPECRRSRLNALARVRVRARVGAMRVELVGV